MQKRLAGVSDKSLPTSKLRKRLVSDRDRPDCSKRCLGGLLMAGIMLAESVLIRAREWHEFGKAVLAEPRQPRKHSHLF